jgi:hypothetical protein
MDDAEAIGREVYEAAGMPSDAAPDGGAVELALRLFGQEVIYERPKPMVEAGIAVIGGTQRIVLKAGISHRRANFLVAAMLVRLVTDAPFSLEDSAAAWIVAPSAAFRREIAVVGIDIGELACRFAVTETCAALRTFEVTARDGAVMTPDRVYKRGPMLARVDDVDVIAMTKRRKLASCKRLAIGDEPGRIALLKTA